ncbi:MAG: sugar phosphate isomerase/epimerase and 4-hydroxyphenylpyruvate domain-containing protein [Roseibium sp.]|uniref:bifunctional sugar phosphate isomerase/epimerase/4-hydroxyphenylpyruvate dioxygenase family protein n=1 Tax=Roseibium sp. TaxID=1936156 RepID=UPI001B1B41F2|nr:sugar phosphate isomerase/epimerase and 4-hydroxyphenylpyruvate domain-containing protein [Roseibium sp.]MBO6892438.1 sugar phosphate isomerase/epimerase and 4-hydroxyphenylpyruvate domain-containing protein [Roseibium sp.]MBO6928704.1 sugar phosphate isomerase/epimerase and 4-hydroxyphenylpyruvate domain-containing protein [Roseibium sp.]
MSLCISTTSIPGDLPAKLKAIAAAGFESVELHDPDFTGFHGTAREIRDIVSGLGLKVALLKPFHDLEGQLDQQVAFDRLEAKFDLMEALGTKMLLVGSARTMQTGIEQDRIVEDLSNAADRAQRRGLKIAYLALPWAQATTHDLQASALVEAVGCDSFGLALNSFFSLAGGRRPADLRDLDLSALFHVQLSDAPRLDTDIRMLKRHFGLLPGLGRLNLSGFVKVLARSGYRGPWSIARLNEQDLEVRAGQITRDGYRALASLLDDVSGTEPGLGLGSPALPDRGHVRGFEFIEFATDERTHRQLADILQSLCFRMERRHVSKSVELWRQGAINIVINSDQTGFAHSAFLSHGPCVCDMGMRVDDASQTVARATELGTEPFSQAVGSGELEIPAIRGVGGSVVHFIDEKSDLHRVWDIEFEPVKKTAATRPAGLRRVDHVAQTMASNEMRSWALYYMTTFDMRKSEIVDVADPAGVVRSQALETPEGEMRLNLNGAAGHRTFAGSFLADQFGAGVQHIAFLTDDIFETSNILDAAGFPRLEMPANYYDDLRVRFGLDMELVETMRSANILYDREGGTEYFQIYSQPIFNGFFFEIVERRSGYQGYGASNAPIRLAAQMRLQRAEGMPLR